MVENREEIAAYISDMSAELADLAGRADLPTVAYFLQLARIEGVTALDEFGSAADPVMRGASQREAA